MNAFQLMIDQIFEVPQFKQYFVLQEDQKQIVCISYETTTDTIYTEYGIDDGISNRITCKIVDYSPKKGDKILFRGKRYKVDSYTADSFNLTYIISLKDLSSK